VWEREEHDIAGRFDEMSGGLGPLRLGMKAGFGAFLVSIGSTASPSAVGGDDLPYYPYGYEEYCGVSDKLKRMLIHLNLRRARQRSCMRGALVAFAAFDSGRR
jgi:hypothetical protein